MKLPLSWLKEYVDIACPVDEYAARMVMIGNGVEDVIDLSAQIERVVVGHILSITKHPNADALLICQVDVGEKTVQIVTGAPNVKEGDYVPVALDASLLPGGKKIKSGKLRGELSEGMLCSGPELGVPVELYPSVGEEGILIFQQEHAPGAPVQPIFGLDDHVLDFEVLANRPDCLSVQGMARESAVALGARLTEPEVSVKEGAGGDIKEHVRVTVEEPDLCPRYAARVIKNIKIEPSPSWMRKRLHAAGMRPINNIVDITNYVMLEMGQPMHAFDLSCVRGGHIIVRGAKAGESIKTLDGAQRAMTPNMLVIADEQGATGIAGVMGGEGSEITQNTTQVLLEAACFDRGSVRITGRALGLRTESSGRFERGVDVSGVGRALDRAAQLVELLGAGEVVAGVIDVYPQPRLPVTITASTDAIRKINGVDTSDEEIVRILASLRCEVQLSEGVIRCTPPPERQDLGMGADLAEEVLRVYGYDKIPATLMQGTAMQAKMSPRRRAERIITRLLCGAGYDEVKTFSFQSPKIFDQLLLPQDAPLRTCVKIRNPLGEDFSIMRTTLLGSMLQTLAFNVNRNNPGNGFFEVASCYLPVQWPIVDTLPDERETVVIGLYGDHADFYDLKGTIEAMVMITGLKKHASYVRSEEPYFHPGRSATLLIDGEQVAQLGEVHPDVRENFGLATRAYIAQVDLRTLRGLMQPLLGVAELPKYPAVTRDLALVMKDDIPAGDVMEMIRQRAGKLLEVVELFDVYRGRPIEEGYKSVAYTMTLRAADHTLTEKEIIRVVDKVLAAVEQEHDIKLRS